MHVARVGISQGACPKINLHISFRLSENVSGPIKDLSDPIHKYLWAFY